MRVSADLQTRCKRWKTAVARFKKKFGQNPVIRGWLPWMEEGFENGCFSESSIDVDGGYGYGIEAIGEGEYYIWLTCYGEYAKEAV